MFSGKRLVLGIYPPGKGAGPPPGALSGVSVTGNQMGHADVAFTAPPSANVARVAIYRVPAGGVLNRTTHLITKISVTPSQAKAYVDGDDTVSNLVTDPGFDSAVAWTFGANWEVNAAGALSKARKVVAGANTLSQPFSPTPGTVYRAVMVVANNSAGVVRMRFAGSGGTNVVANSSGNGTFYGSNTAIVGNTTIAFEPDASWNAGSTIDDAKLFAQTVACAPQGLFDYYLEAENGAGLPGTQASVANVLIY